MLTVNNKEKNQENKNVCHVIVSGFWDILSAYFTNVLIT